MGKLFKIILWNYLNANLFSMFSSLDDPFLIHDLLPGL
jgi:hypothetical protein